VKGRVFFFPVFGEALGLGELITRQLQMQRRLGLVRRAHLFGGLHGGLHFRQFVLVQLGATTSSQTGGDD
jgi:hypothetical protein